MHGSIIRPRLLALAIAVAANALTLYKCELRNGGGIVYQEDKPSESECLIEKKELDPNANVIPAAEFIGGQQPEDASEEPQGKQDQAGEEDGTTAAEQ